MTTAAPVVGAPSPRDLLLQPGPVASVYIAHTPFEPRDATALRWRALADQPGFRTAGDATQCALDDHLDRWLEHVPPDFAGTLALIAHDGAVVLARELPGSQHPDLAVSGPLPCVLPLLVAEQKHPAHVVVVTDRGGADISLYRRGEVVPRTTRVTGPDDEIQRKRAPGGISQPRHQHRTQDSWRHNAATVAKVTAHVLGAAGAKLLVVSGDVRAIQLLEERLPTSVWQQVAVRQVPGGRGKDGSWPARQARIREEVRRLAAAETRMLLAAFAERRGPAGRAAEGARPTLAALARGQVATLLVTHDPADRRGAWFGPAPHQVACLASTLRRAGVRHPQLGRLPDVATRAALLSGARVHVLPPGLPGAPAEGIGGLCRFSGGNGPPAP